MNIKRNAAVLIAAASIGALGIGGVVGAHADAGSGTPSQSKVSHEKSDGDGEVPDSQEGADGETNDDATDTGPDADPNEPGHQDASDQADDEKGEAGEADEKSEGAEQSDGDGEVPDAQESSTN